MKRDFNVGTIVDRLGTVKAAISSMNDEAEAHKALIIGLAASGPERSFEGALYRATVSFTDKTVIDWRALLDELVASGRVHHDVLEHLVGKHTHVAEGVPVVRVSARKGS